MGAFNTGDFLIGHSSISNNSNFVNIIISIDISDNYFFSVQCITKR